MNEFTCQAAAEALLTPAPPPAVQTALTAHLAACPACRAEAAEWALLRQCWEEAADSAPPELADRVMAAVAPPARPAPDPALPLLALLVVALATALVTARAATLGHLEPWLAALARGWDGTAQLGPAALDWLSRWAAGWSALPAIPGAWWQGLGLAAGMVLLAALVGAYQREHRHA